MAQMIRGLGQVSNGCNDLPGSRIILSVSKSVLVYFVVLHLPFIFLDLIVDDLDLKT